MKRIIFILLTVICLVSCNTNIHEQTFDNDNFDVVDTMYLSKNQHYVSSHFINSAYIVLKKDGEKADTFYQIGVQYPTILNKIKFKLVIIQQKN